MLIRSQPECAFVHPRDLTETSLEFFPRFILHASILDEYGEVVPAVKSFAPPELVDILGELERPRRSEPVAEQFLNFVREVLKSHSVYSVF